MSCEACHIRKVLARSLSSERSGLTVTRDQTDQVREGERARQQLCAVHKEKHPMRDDAEAGLKQPIGTWWWVVLVVVTVCNHVYRRLTGANGGQTARDCALVFGVFGVLVGVVVVAAGTSTEWRRGQGQDQRRTAHP